MDIAHLLRPAHLRQLRAILDDPESSDNDKFVALELLKNANIAAGMVLPGEKAGRGQGSEGEGTSLKTLAPGSAVLAAPED